MRHLQCVVLALLPCGLVGCPESEPDPQDVDAPAARGGSEANLAGAGGVGAAASRHTGTAGLAPSMLRPAEQAGSSGKGNGALGSLPKGGPAGAGGHDAEPSGLGGSAATRDDEPAATVVQQDLIDCTTTPSELDGWTQLIDTDATYVTNEVALVELQFGIKLDDTLRVDENLFGYALADRFSDFQRIPLPDPIHPGQDRDFFYGYAALASTGQTVFIGYKPFKNNGTAYPVLAITDTEQDFWALFPNSDALIAMQRYNAFPLRCADVLAAWTTSSMFSFQTWALDGTYTGTVYSDTVVNLALGVNGHYAWDATVYTNGFAQRESYKGTFELADRQLVLHDDTGKDTSYDAVLVAVRDGVELYIIDQHATGMRYQFQRRR